MARAHSLDALLRALRVAWLRAGEAAALQYRWAPAGAAGAAASGGAMPGRLVVQPPAQAAGMPTFEIDAADLVERRWIHPASLALAFDCELRQRRDGSWRLHVVHPRRIAWWSGRPRHRVDIVVDGAVDAGGEVRFDGQVWRRFGGARR
jgi:hypothetical protein